MPYLVEFFILLAGLGLAVLLRRQTGRLWRIWLGYLVLMLPWLAWHMWHVATFIQRPLLATYFSDHPDEEQKYLSYAAVDVFAYLAPAAGLALARLASQPLGWPFLRTLRRLLRRQRTGFPLALVMTAEILHQFLYVGTRILLWSSAHIHVHWSLPTAAVIGTCTAAVREEVVYRGFVLTGLAWMLRHFRYGTLVAVLVSSGLWGMMHTGQSTPLWVRPLDVALFGCVLAWMRIRWGLEASLAVHLLINAGFGYVPLPVRLFLVAVAMVYPRLRKRPQEPLALAPS